MLFQVRQQLKAANGIVWGASSEETESALLVVASDIVKLLTGEELHSDMEPGFMTEQYFSAVWTHRRVFPRDWDGSFQEFVSFFLKLSLLYV